MSSAVEPFSNAELQALLKKARANNTRDGITGMLLYRDGNFMQILEGKEEIVRATFARIARDPRHRGMIVLLRGDEEGRQFADWSMGFRDLESDGAHTAPGYSEFLNSPLTSEEFSTDLTRCRRLLLSFKQSGEGGTDCPLELGRGV